MKKRMIKNLLLVVVMAVLCVAVGMTASAGNYEDIWSQGFANENQAVIVFDLDGGKIDGTVENFNLESMSFETVTELSGKYIMVPKNETEQKERGYVNFPYIKAPEYHNVKGWYLAAQNTIYAPGSKYIIPISTAGTVIEFKALYEDNTTYNLVDGVLSAGENLTWSFDETTGTLEISGEGEMYDFDDENYIRPWEENVIDVHRVIIGDGVTSVGNKAFEGFQLVTDVSISNTVITIGDRAFESCMGLSEIVIPDSVTTIGDYAFNFCSCVENIYLSKNIKSIGLQAFSQTPCLEKAFIKSIDVELSDYVICATEYAIYNISREEFISLYREFIRTLDEQLIKKLGNCIKILDYKVDDVFIGTIYCHAGSTAEKYAIENGVDYELTHFFEGEWTYDYDNMIRYRKCIHCDELETEPLETTESGDVEIIEPTNPDTDFTVDVIEDYVVIEETISNNITTDFEIVKAFDINLKNKDGVHVQPDGTVKVKLPLDWSKNGVYKVYRVNDDGTLTDMNAYRQGSHLVFDTDHFSIYVIVVEGAEPEAPTEPDTPATPDEESKDNFFSKILDWFRALLDLIMSMFK